MRFESVIPIMTADSQGGYVISQVSGRHAFDGSTDTYYRSGTSPSLPEYLAITFPIKFIVSRYRISLGYAPSSPEYYNMAEWDLEGLVNGVWIVLHSGSHPNIAETLTYDFAPIEVDGIRIKCKVKHGTNSWGVNELTLYSPVYEEKTLVFHDGLYKTYTSGNWEIVGSTVGENDYISKGISDIFSIPKSAWSLLSGNVELNFWSENPNRVNTLFDVQTDSFTLSEEFKEQALKITQYSDDPYIEESRIQLNTEEFNFNDEFKNEIDVLYYTDDPQKTSAELEFVADYSPLDELNNSSVVVWTDDEESMKDKKLSVTAIPKPKLIKQTKDIYFDGVLNKIEIQSTVKDEGFIRTIFSTDGGVNWKTIRVRFNGEIVVEPINILDLQKVKKYGCKLETILSVSEAEWKKITPQNRIRFGYYIEQDNIADIATVDALLTTEILVTETPSINSVSVLYDAIDSRYYGLMFLDTSQNYYSTSVGEILKYLDMGTLIAGQTSLEAEIFLMNTLNYDVKDVNMWVSENMDDVTIEMSEITNPFIAQTSIQIPFLASGANIPFYIRIKTNKSATAGGNFDIMVKADPAN